MGCVPANEKLLENSDEFSFVFITDIHLQPERGAPQAFQKIIDSVNKMNVDFVLTGGDLVYDVLRGNFERSDSLFRMYKKAIEGFNVPVYNCIGNHEFPLGFVQRSLGTPRCSLGFLKFAYVFLRFSYTLVAK